jgi:SPP1 gp7 family putative phage head morphogenesis protein
VTRFDLKTLARRNSRRLILFRPILTTRAQAESLALIYLRSIEQLEARLPRLNEIYARTVAAQLRTDSVDELGQEIDEADAALRRLVLELEPSLRRWAFRTEEWHRGQWKRAVLDAVSVQLETVIGSQDVRETIAAWLQRNTGLIRNINDEARAKIADSIFRGFTRRSTASEMAVEIREHATMARKRAIRIAGDQTVKLASALDAERQRQAGLTEWSWLHSGKLHPREEHKARDGKIYDDSGKEVGGDEQIPPDDLPGQPPYCGCVRRAVLNFK